MNFNRNKLYTIIFIACTAGYIWLYFNLNSNKTQTIEVCFIKHITDIPCPSCGSTRSVVLLVTGNFIDALLINPLGYVVAIIIFLAPIWIVIDLTTSRKTLFEFYRKIETYLKNPKYSIPLIMLVVINWIWNIKKGL